MLKSRPDKDTGNDGEWHRQYNIYRDTGGDHEKSGHESRLNASEDAQDEETRKEMLEMLDTAAACMGGGSSSGEAGAGATIKVEGDKKTASSSDTPLPIHMLRPLRS